MQSAYASQQTRAFVYIRVLALLLALLAVLALANCGSSSGLVVIAITPANPSVAKGDHIQLHATGTYLDGSHQDLTDIAAWEFNMPNTISLNDKGEVEARGEGAALVTASYQGVTGRAYVTVGVPVLVAISLAPSPLSVPLGESRQVTATGKYSDGSTQDITQSVNWSSSGTAIATVSATGLVLGSSLGNVTIIASSGTVFGSMPLDVNQAVLLSIAVTPAQSSLPQGDTEQLTATGTYSNGTTQNLTQTVAWASSGSTVASVSATGTALASTLGTVTVSATSGSVSGTATLTVTAPVVISLNVTPATLSIELESSSQLQAIATWSNGATQDVTSSVSWSATPAGFVTIAYFGLVTAQQVGTTTIFANYGGVTATVNVTVLPLLYVNYFNRINAQASGIDGTMRIVNPGLTTGGPSNGNMCAMIYVFDSNQELNECCGCSISDHGLRTLSLLNDLTSNTLTKTKPKAGTILMIPSDITQNPQCNPSSLAPTGALPAWQTNDQATGDGTYTVTETDFQTAPLNSDIAANVAGLCSFIQSQGSGHGVCSCGSGGN